jgi:hypothetical protein
VALKVAKARISGENIDYDKSIDDQLSGLRGFLNSDLKRITDAIESHFV